MWGKHSCRRLPLLACQTLGKQDSLHIPVGQAVSGVALESADDQDLELIFVFSTW